MRAVIVTTPGGLEALDVVDLPVPEPAAGDVLIRVIAAGVNRADLMQRRGFYPPPPGASEVLGLECSGEVVAVGPGADPDLIGREVVALLSGGGYAEFVAVPAGQIAPVPEGVSAVDAAGLLETIATVWSNVFSLAALQTGDTLLVHGGASGIGTTAIQMGVAAGARVAVTVGSPDKAVTCRDLGAELAIEYRETDFVEALAEAGLHPDVILDTIGAKYLDRNVRALATGGRIVTIGLLGGTRGELDLGRLLGKRGSIAATSLRARPTDEKAAIVAGVVDQVWPWVAAGRVRPIVHATLPLAEVAEAHRILEASEHTGKVLLTL